jgi:hypothetical protein
MDISRALNEFVSRGNELFQRMNTDEGELLTETELAMLRTQLHVISVQAYQLQSMKVLRAHRPHEVEE